MRLLSILFLLVGPPAMAQDGDPAASEELPILEAPSVKTFVNAPYPPEAKEAGLQGQVRLVVQIDETGTVLDVQVAEPAGHGFDEAAVEALQQMSFNPALNEQGPVGVVFEFVYAFTLNPEVSEGDAEVPVNVDGIVRQMGTRLPLEEAIVTLDGTSLSAVTDAEGRFELRGVPIGSYTLRVEHAENKPSDVPLEVLEGEISTARLWLRPYPADEIVVIYNPPKQEITRRTLSIEEIKRIPGSFGDPVKVIQTLPGAARSPFGTGLLIIRGANPEDTAVYVDGVRIPIVYHLTGTTSVLSPEVVSEVDYLPGGYGTQYGRSMAGTIDIKTKESFDDSKLVWGTDLLDSQVWYEGNLGKNKQHGFAIGARRSYIDLFIPLFTPNTGFRIQPIYWDYQLKWIPKLGDRDSFSVFVYGFQDILRISTPDDVAQGSDQDTQGDLETRYQSHRLVLNYSHEFSERFRINLRPSVGIDTSKFGLGNDFSLTNSNVIMQLRAEAQWQMHKTVELVHGLDFIGGPYRFDFRSPLSFSDLNDPLAERDPIGFDGRGGAWSPTPYVKAKIRPLKDPEQWLITPGVRFNNVTYVVKGDVTQGETVEPTSINSIDLRLGTRLRVFEKNDQSLSIKASSGTYHQPPQPFESIGLGTTVRLKAERSWNSSVGIEHQITPAISWDLEGFYRRMDRLVEFNDSFVGVGSQPFANAGEGYAAGAELIIRHAPANKFFGWISYTFSRSFRRSRPDADWVPFDFDQPHIFSAQGGYDLPFDIGISAQLQVVSGNPDSPLDAGIYDVDGDFYNGFRTGPANSERLPTFVQSSFRIDKTWTLRKYKLVTYLDLINAVRGVNPEATIYNYDFSENAYVRGFPFVPNLGIELVFRP